jgi:hypothetical protein
MEPEKKSSGAIVGLIVIIIILIVGGVYLWQNSVKDKILPANSTLNTGNVPGTTDDTASIEADLNNIDLESLDQGI